MRIALLVLVVSLAGCEKKKEAAKTETPPPAVAPKVDEKPKAVDPAPDEKPTPTEPAAPAAGEPTKEMAVQRLKDMLAALEAKDYKKAMTMMAPSAKIPADRMEESLQKVLEIKEISAKGIEIIAAKGTWGKLADIAPDKGERWAAKFDVPVDQCWGMVHGNGEVGFHWDGKQLRFIRLDDVGKLE